MPYRDKGFYSRKHQKLIGKKFNRLQILEIWKDPRRGYYMCKCQCDCGATKENRLTYVTTGAIQSCGCIKYKYRTPPAKMQNVFDGRSKHPLHKTWNAMLDRCENPNSNMYRIYGGRGIKVCQEWHDFWQFVEWSESVGGKQNGLSLDRIDVNGDYCPDNCRWATDETQQNNKTTSRYLTYQGETHTLAEWCRVKNLSRYAVQYRFMQGWSAEDILEVPLNCRKKDFHRTILQKTPSNVIVAKYKGLTNLPGEYKATSVSSVCNGTYPHKTYKGYVWEYAEG